MRRILIAAALLILGLVIVFSLGNRENHRQPTREADESIENRPEDPGAVAPEDIARETDDPPFATVAGRVLDESGKPIADARVELYAMVLYADPCPFDEAATDDAGCFVLQQRRRAQSHEFLYVAAGKEGFTRLKKQLSSPRQDIEFRLRRTYPLKVEVRDPEGNPLAGVKVRASPIARNLPSGTRIDCSQTTDERGLARLMVPQAQVTVSVGKSGWSYQSIKHTIDPDTEETVQLVLKPGVTIKGRFVERGTDQGIPDVHVYWGAENASTVSDEQGRFTTCILPESDGLQFLAPWHTYRGYVNLRNMPSGTVVERVFELDPAAQVEGTVLDSSGNPVEGAYVAVNSRVAGDAASRRAPARIADAAARTDDRGRFLLTGVRIGEDVRIHAVLHEEAEGCSDALKVAPGETTRDVVVRLSKGFTVIIIPLTEKGEVPLRCMARVSPRVAQRHQRGVELPTFCRRMASLMNGELRLWGLAEGDYQVTLDANGYLPKVIPFSELLRGGSGTERRVKVELERGLTIAGMVKDEDGKPLSGVSILAYATADRGQRRSARTGEDGCFVLQGLAPGDYRLTARGSNVPGGRIELVAVAAGTQGVVLAPSSTCSLEGRFIDSNGQPLHGWVNAWSVKEKSRSPIPGHRDHKQGYARGEFRLDLEPGDWWIGFRTREGARTTPVRVQITPGKNKLPEQRLPGMRKLIGTVRGPGGPLADAEVSFWPSALQSKSARPWFGRMGGGNVKSGADGTFAIGPLGSGGWMLQVVAPGYLAATVEIDIPEGAGETRQDVALELGAYLAIQLIHPQEERLWASATLSTPQGPVKQPTSRSNPPEAPGPGFRVFGPYPPGSYSAELRGICRTKDRLRIRLEREVTVLLRAGEMTKLSIEFTQAEVDEAIEREEEK